MTAPALSVVIPMYNEQEVLPLLIARLRPLLDGAGLDYEVVAVDDGSVDATAPMLLLACRQWARLRVVRLRRNSGHQAALTAGLHRARGEFVASIDADLQDPPEKILEMLALARAESLDIVYGVRDDRTADTFFKRHTAQAYYRVMRRLVGKKVPHNAGDFRLLSRDAVEALRAMPERRPVYRLLVPWLGFPSGEVRYRREVRAAGSTKYPLSRMVKLAVDSVTDFSAAPLRLATWSGLLSFVVCFVLGCYSVVRFVMGETVSGWTSLFTAILFLGGVQLLCLGLLGEYLGRLYAEVKGRPTYIVGYDSAEAGEQAFASVR
ncbi:glycosyltransferase family 2 protein [Catellatospora vulcania]|uniref:glycosyltransferase family 2 protein n=1 Tax=Catellatospora vulcania TaxID=1460450 RepID=UPI0012D3892B|nr:glycosyltransferase family 2 protein [Catellatospora vulcania]